MSLRELCELSAAADDSIWFTCWCNCEDSSAIIVTAGIDETIRLHSFTQNENDTASIAALLPAQKTISMNNALGCTSLIASPLQDTRSFVYSAWMDGTIRAIDTNSINSSTESTKLPPKKDWIIECGAGDVWALAHHPRMGLLATTTHTGNVNIWDISSASSRDILKTKRVIVGENRKSETNTLTTTSTQSTPGMKQFGMCIKFSKSGDEVISGHADGSLQIFDIHSNTVKERIKPHAASIRTLSVSGDGNSVYTGSEDGIIGIFDRRSAQQTGQLRGHSAWITSLARSPTVGEAAYGTSLPNATEDGAIKDSLLLLSSSADASIRLWDMRMKESIQSNEQNQSPIWSMDWVRLKTGQFVIAGGEDATLRLFSAPR